jgi:hypothetical protein
LNHNKTQTVKRLSTFGFEIFMADRIAVVRTGNNALALYFEFYQVIGVGADTACLVHDPDCNLRKISHAEV